MIEVEPELKAQLAQSVRDEIESAHRPCKSLGHRQMWYIGGMSRSCQGGAPRRLRPALPPRAQSTPPTAGLMPGAYGLRASLVHPIRPMRRPGCPCTSRWRGSPLGAILGPDRPGDADRAAETEHHPAIALASDTAPQRTIALATRQSPERRPADERSAMDAIVAEMARWTGRESAPPRVGDFSVFGKRPGRSRRPTFRLDRVRRDCSGAMGTRRTA